MVKLLRTTLLLFLIAGISLLFWGCGRLMRAAGSKEKSTAPPLPFLPDLKEAAEVAVDAGFIARNFVIAEDRSRVFLLTYGTAGDSESMPYRLLKLDAQGAILARLELPRREWVERAALWWNGSGRLSLMMQESILTIDPESLRVVEEFRLIHEGNFLPRRKLEELIPREAQEAYAEALAKARAAHPEAQVQTPPKGREPFVLIGKSAWVVPGETPTPSSGGGQPNEGESMEDDRSASKLTCESSQVIGTRLNYPRYVEERLNTYALSKSGGRRILRFQTTDRGGRDLELYIADDRKLTTLDGSVWLRFEKRLYRVALAVSGS